jgi:hypothetical protein
MLATQVTGPLLVWWWVALALGLIVAVAVAALLQWLLLRVRQIEDGADQVWVAGQTVARNTSTTWLLTQTAGIVEEIRDETRRHDALLRRLGG